MARSREWRDVVYGAAEILWADNWASHADEHDCCNLSGCEITSVMPPVPWPVWLAAGRLVRRVEQVHLASIESILERAREANEHGPRYGHRRFKNFAERFGHCMAFEAMGAGVSWTDDNNPIPFYKVPYKEYGEFRFLADSLCKEWSPKQPCKGCGYYVLPGLRCAECGRLARKSRKK